MKTKKNYIRDARHVLRCPVFAGKERGGYSFAPCLSHLPIDHAPLSRRSTVPTPNREISNIQALITCLVRVFLREGGGWGGAGNFGDLIRLTRSNTMRAFGYVSSLAGKIGLLACMPVCLYVCLPACLPFCRSGCLPVWSRSREKTRRRPDCALVSLVSCRVWIKTAIWYLGDVPGTTAQTAVGLSPSVLYIFNLVL